MSEPDSLLLLLARTSTPIVPPPPPETDEPVEFYDGTDLTFYSGEPVELYA